MNEIAKKAASDKLQAAIVREKVTTKEAGELIGIQACYISMFKNPKLWPNIGPNKWLQLTKWVNSGESLKTFSIRYPQRTIPNSEEKQEENKIITSSGGEIDPVAKALFQQSIDNVAKKEDEITDVDFEDPIQDKDAYEKLPPEVKKNLIDEVKMRLAQDKRTIHEFIKRNATIIITKDDNHYYFLPYWFLDTKEGSYELYPLGRLPEDLKEAIKNLRGE